MNAKKKKNSPKPHVPEEPSKRALLRLEREPDYELLLTSTPVTATPRRLTARWSAEIPPTETITNERGVTYYVWR